MSFKAIKKALSCEGTRKLDSYISTTAKLQAPLISLTGPISKAYFLFLVS